MAALIGCVVGGVVALANTGGSASNGGSGTESLPVTSSGSATGGGTSSESASRTPAPRPVSAAQLAALPPATTFGQIGNAPADPAPGSPTDGGVVHPKRTVPVYLSPGGPAIGAVPIIQVGQDTWFPVIGHKDKWVLVALPSKPNGRVGWLYDGDGSLSTAKSTYQIRVDLATFKMTVFDNNKPLGTWTVGTGMDVDPTPTGRAFILSSIADTQAKYSPVILPLSVHSPTLSSFGGGPGTVAIHTWLPTSAVYGTKTSNGCIRVPPDALSLIQKAPLGTLVLIH